MIALLLLACRPDNPEHAGKDDTGGVDSPGDTDTEETAAPIECEDEYDTDIAYTPAEPCDPTLPWVDVSAGVTLTCGVKSDGCGQCWGFEADAPDFAIPDVPFRSIRLTAGIESADTDHICGLRTDGGITCWAGSRDYAENFAPLGTYTAIATGSVSAAAIRDDGSIQAWGRESGCTAGPYREVLARNLDLAALREDGTAEELPTVDQPVAYPGRWRSIALGFLWICGIRSDLDDAVSCLYYGGSTVDGQEVEMPDRPTGPMLDVCVGTHEACALDELGTPVCWSIPNGTDTLANPPPGPFVSITCGAVHACALTADGRIECWGHDSAGETIPPS